MSNTERKRNIAITFRMRVDEYAALQSKVNESGLTQQAYLISSAIGGTITSFDEIAVLKEISKTLSIMEHQFHGFPTNIKQMARVAKEQGNLLTMNKLDQITEQITQHRKECEKIWLLIRLSINQQNHTEQ